MLEYVALACNFSLRVTALAAEPAAEPSAELIFVGIEPGYQISDGRLVKRPDFTPLRIWATPAQMREIAGRLAEWADEIDKIFPPPPVPQSNPEEKAP